MHTITIVIGALYNFFITIKYRILGVIYSNQYRLMLFLDCQIKYLDGVEHNLEFIFVIYYS